MALSIGLIGLPQSGKTTAFNALTRSHAEVGYGAGKKANVAVVNVPDERLNVLTGIFKPKKTVPAQVQYTDVAGMAPGHEPAKGELGKSILDALQKVDALLLVVRAFEDESGIATNPEADLETVLLELTLADLGVVERRIQKIEEQRKKMKLTDAEERERPMLAQVKEALESGRPVRDLALDEETLKALRNYQLTTARPLLVVLNVGEGDLPKRDELCERLRPRLAFRQTMVTALCGKIEAEMADLDPAEAEEFIAGLGIGEPGLNRVIRMSYELLGLISFLTVGPDEVRAWPVRRGSLAPRAAGAVHSDIEKGFIRAEVVRFEDLVRFGAIPEAKKHGMVRLEGKTYEVQDGDVIEYLFSPPSKSK